MEIEEEQDNNEDNNEGNHEDEEDQDTLKELSLLFQPVNWLLMNLSPLRMSNQVPAQLYTFAEMATNRSFKQADVDHILAWMHQSLETIPTWLPTNAKRLYEEVDTGLQSETRLQGFKSIEIQADGYTYILYLRNILELIYIILNKDEFKDHLKFKFSYDFDSNNNRVYSEPYHCNQWKGEAKFFNLV